MRHGYELHDVHGWIQVGLILGDFDMTFYKMLSRSLDSGPAPKNNGTKSYTRRSPNVPRLIMNENVVDAIIHDENRLYPGGPGGKLGLCWS